MHLLDETYLDLNNAFVIIDACLRCQTDGKQEECVGECLVIIYSLDFIFNVLYSGVGRVQSFISQLLHAALDKTEQ